MALNNMHVSLIEGPLEESARNKHYAAEPDDLEPEEIAAQSKWKHQQSVPTPGWLSPGHPVSRN